jgi:putative cell wall-binding protein
MQNGPVLLVTSSAIPAVVVAELSRLKPARIVVLGGPAAISDTVKAQAESVAQ